MPANLAALRSTVELALAGRVSAPFNFRHGHAFPTVSCGIPEIDSLTVGLPRGALTEIFGPGCSGRTSLLFSALGARTACAEACALIDGGDAFDPHSAQAAGVNLKNLLWVRCRNIDHALRAADLLLQSGGFGFIALDLGDLPPRVVRHVPLDCWFRFRRAVENTFTILVLLGQESNAKTCASLVLRLEAQPPTWSTTLSTRAADAPHYSFAASQYSLSRLLRGFSVRAEVSRSRVQLQQVNGPPFQGPFHSSNRTGASAVFQTTRDYLGSMFAEPKRK